MPAPAIPFVIWGIGGLLLGGAAHELTPGKEQREHDLENLGGAIFGSNATQMEQADTDSEKDAIPGTMTEVCSTCPPPPDSECGRLYAKLQELVQQLSNRRAAMLADRSVSQGGLGMYELFLKDPFAKVPDPRGIKPDLGSWTGHKDQILQKQENLKRNMKKYRQKKCGVLPTGAETQSELLPPTRPFK